MGIAVGLPTHTGIIVGLPAHIIEAIGSPSKLGGGMAARSPSRHVSTRS